MADAGAGCSTIMPFDRPYMISYLSSIVTMLCTISETLLLFPKRCHVIVTTRFGYSGDILEGTRNLNGSCYLNHATFRGWFIIPLATIDIVSLCTKFDSSSLSHY